VIKPRRIGHAAFETPDLDRQVAYYTDVMGLVLAAQDKGRAWLATKLGQIVIELAHGATARCTRLSFEVAPSTQLSDAARVLAADGITSELRSDPLPGMPKALLLDDQKGTILELFAEWSFVGANQPVAGVGPLKLGHVAFVVPDPRATADFYERVLGFRVSDWIEDFFVFLRCNSDHHTVNFIKGSKVGLHHMAFELKDWAHIQNACDLLGQRNIAINWGPARLGPGHNLAAFHRNPDDQLVEVFAELDQMKDEQLGYFEPRPWHRDRPQRPKVWQGQFARMMWGTPPTPDFLRGRD
jgi:catechol 2,3-dioxygenase-like lactoylglutathione lyase family enzyme